MKKAVVGSLALVVLSIISVARDGNALISPKKSQNDKREYGYFVLPNRMKVLLVSDPDGDKAAASLSVNIGSTSEPSNHNGLAHFLEHMLFMGTKKYPDVNGYQKYIVDHGGTTNAYTSKNTTNFSFAIKADKLEWALDMFSQFFISPLFDPRYVDREKHAVDSEYHLKTKKEIRRVLAAITKVYNPASPYSRFTVGNLETLADKPNDKVHDELLKFYRTHYSANLMSLAVLGRETVPQLKKMVQERFAAVKDINASPYTPTDQTLALPSSTLPAALMIKPITDTHNLTLVFPMPPQRELYDINPYRYLNYLIADSSKGSFFDAVREKGWISSVSATGSDMDYGQGQYTVNIDLEPEGLKHVKEILKLFYSYIDLIDKKGIQPWRYKERQYLDGLLWRFAVPSEPFDYVTDLSDKLHFFPPKDVLTAGSVLAKYDEKVIRRYLGFIRPDNVLNILVDPSVPVDKSEKWYQVQYSKEKVTPEDAQKLLEPLPDTNLSLPIANIFIPKDLKLKKADSDSTIPISIIDKPGFALWHKIDTEFGTPRASVSILLDSPVLGKSAESAVGIRLWIKILEDQLVRVQQLGFKAGLGFGLESDNHKLTISLFGYNDKMHQLLKVVLDNLSKGSIDLKHFDRQKRILGQYLFNKQHEYPFKQVLGAVMRDGSEGAYSPQELLKALEGITQKTILSLKEEFFKSLQVRILVLGNLSQKDGVEIADTVKKRLLTDTHLVKMPEPVIHLSPKKQPKLIDYPVVHTDSVVVRKYIDDNTSAAHWAKWNLLENLMKRPYAEELRTREQLGYVAEVAFTSQYRYPGLLMIIESSNTLGTQLNQRVGAFVESFEQYLENLDAKTLSVSKRGLISILRKKDLSLGERSSRYTGNLIFGINTFDFNSKIADNVEKLSTKDMLEFYREYVLHNPRATYCISQGGKQISSF